MTDIQNYVNNFNVKIKVVVGTNKLNIKDLMKYKKNNNFIFQFIETENDEIKLYIQNKLIGYGSLHLIDNQLAVKIEKLLS